MPSCTHTLSRKMTTVYFIVFGVLLQLSKSFSFPVSVGCDLTRLKTKNISSGAFYRHHHRHWDNCYVRCTNKSLHFLNSLVLHGSTRDELSNETKKHSFYVRNALYSELGKVADILIESFYNPSPLVRQFLYLSELSRLQGNFPYSAPDHSFFVACQKTTDGPGSIQNDIIVGFVDVDARPGTKESDAPRPYLSDLAVHPAYRRKGVAQSLVRECEEEVKIWGKDELHLRVEKRNNGALNMYSKLGYEALEHHYFGVKDTTILLRNEFHQKEDAISSAHEELVEESNGEVTASTNEDVTFVI